MDMYLSFRLDSASFLFNQLSDALEWIVKHNYRIRIHANWGLAKNINRAYSCREKHFLELCLMNRLLGTDGDVLPASEATLVYFASYLARTVRHSTIKLYLAAVRNLHITAGYNELLLRRKILHGILRYQGQQRIRRQPVTPQVLLAIRLVLQS